MSGRIVGARSRGEETARHDDRQSPAPAVPLAALASEFRRFGRIGLASARIVAYATEKAARLPIEEGSERAVPALIAAMRRVPFVTEMLRIEALTLNPAGCGVPASGTVVRRGLAGDR